MKELLKRLLNKWTCCHEWVEYKKINVYEDGYGDIPVYYKYLFICKKCGKMKKVQM